jgi:hypothetical protein
LGRLGVSIKINCKKVHFWLDFNAMNGYIIIRMKAVRGAGLPAAIRPIDYAS